MNRARRCGRCCCGVTKKMPAIRSLRSSSTRRKNIEFHDGAFKLEGLADYYFVTHDAELVRNTRDLWQREIDRIVKSRDKETGLLPREKYCSDIDTPVISISTNANCWRGLRDMALVLADIGDS